MNKHALFLYVIPQDELHDWRKLIFNMVARLVEFDKIEFDAKKVLDDIASESWQVVLVIEEGEAVASGLLSIREIGQGKSLYIIGAVGFEELGADKCKRILRLLEALAKDNGCVRLEWAGRKGWERVFKDEGLQTRVSLIKNLNGESDEEAA
jgi:hypothetical protein